MSTGLTLLGFILYNIFLTCSNVGLWAGLFFLHLLINCSKEREWEKQTAFCHSKHRQCFKLISLFSRCKLSMWSPVCSWWKEAELFWGLRGSTDLYRMENVSLWK